MSRLSVASASSRSPIRYAEIGLRMALGAQPANILQLTMGKGLRTALMGAFAGLLAAVALAKVLASLLYGVHRFDGMVDAGVVLIVFVIALLASYLPARRAMRIDPVRALRQ